MSARRMEDASMAPRSVTIKCLVDDNGGREGLLAEHGLSLLVETDGYTVLFDTGQGKTLQANARALSEVLPPFGKVLLSHGHYDHTGGLKVVLDLAYQTDVYAHPDVLKPKYARGAHNAARSIGIPDVCLDAIESSPHNLRLNRGPVEVVPSVYATGEIPRQTDFEDTGGPFFLDEALSAPDVLIDEQAMVLDCDSGIIVVVGCAHSGLVNTLAHVRRMMPAKPIEAVVGGFHLVNASETRIARTIQELKALDVNRIVAGHCTGSKACTRFADAFDNAFSRLAPGRVFTF